MKFSNLILPALLFGAPSAVVAQARTVFQQSTGVCAGAATSVRNWGWSDGSQDSAASLASIVSAVNRQLRSSEGRLTPAEMARLEKSAASKDACVRELSRGILKTQSGNAARKRADRVADAGKSAELQNLLAAIGTGKSVTRSSEKQSLSREALSP
jgi:hypothetical protein